MKKSLLSVSTLFASMAFLVSQANAQSGDMADVEIRTQAVAPGIAVLFGVGGNIAVSHGEDGTVLIDDQFAPLTGKIQAAIAELGAEPPRFLINTHWHGDHTGGNANFGEAGALIMAHENVRIRLVEGKQRDGSVQPAPPAALPVLTYNDGIMLHLNGDMLDIVHTSHGHTDGDSAIFWKQANVVHTGDLFFNNTSFPFVDIASGGNALALLNAVDEVLARIDDATVVIPGHGPIATRAELLTYREMLADIIMAVRKGRGAGHSVAELQARKLTAPYDRAGGFVSGDAFVEAVYKSLEMEADLARHQFRPESE